MPQRSEGIAPKHSHDVLDAQQAVHLVSEQVGVAILPKPMALAFRPENIVVKALSDTALCIETCLVLRSDDKPRIVNELARAFLRKYCPKPLPPRQMNRFRHATDREIGVQKALGAPRRYTLTQFLAEALTLTVIGGLFGAILAYGVALAVGRLTL